MPEQPPKPEDPRPKRGRNPNGRSTIYQDRRGYWHGRVTVGVLDDGRPDRRHFGGRTKTEVAERVRGLERERHERTVRKLGQKWTVEKWLTYWLENIAAPPHVAENTHSGYWVDVTKHLIPGIGAHRLERLEPEHLEKLYAKMRKAGSSAGTVHHVHRTVRAALNEAVRRRAIMRNPVLLARSPTLDEEDVEPYDVSEVQRLLEAAAKRRNSARWALALALGLRQGEALGLTWDCVDLGKGSIRIRQSRLRPRYAHGCGGTCGGKPGFCPQRENLRDDTGGVKSKAGRRTIGLPPQLIAILRNHQAEQARERALAGDQWRDGGWVFASPTGQPLIPNSDYHAWKRLLRDADLREARLHDARHTAATVLLILGQPGPTVMSLMGWSSGSMAARYQHVTDAMRSEVASQVGELIWTPAAEASKDRLTVRSAALAVLLAAVEDCLARHEDLNDRAELRAALAELDASLAAAAGLSGTPTETKTETKRGRRS